MVPELGHFALIVALVIAAVQGIMPLLGASLGGDRWIALSKPIARTQWLFMAFSFACLTYAFVVNDFSVLYVANNSNTQLPLIYRISAVWGAHEGSLLLWALILSTWAAAVTIFSKSIPPAVLARVVSVMGLISVGFMCFMLFTSNPFERVFPVPAEGRSLNPLLQDFGLAIHPPMLYMGYVGFSVAFAFALAAMAGGKLDAAWARWSRPWTNIAWVFLTLGIALGSWWAYYELGWGGWWFWDPVENASLMPWLIGTALIHSLAVTEKRGAFKAWTVLLAIFAFSLSLLGTFLVRSGVLTSVHAFASDPGRGLFILFFLIVVIGSSLTLFAWRAPKLRSTGTFELNSKETSLLLNNVILVVMCATVLLGTLFPLITDALNIGKYSVGPPYFNTMMVPLGVPLFLLMGLGLLMRWKRDTALRLIKQTWWVLVAALVAAFLLPLLWIPDFEPLVGLGLLMSSWVAFGTLLWISRQGKSPFKQPLANWGAMLAHIGMAVSITGITLVSVFNSERDVRLEPGQTYVLGGYTFRFDGVERIQGPNYIAQRGLVTASQGDKVITVMHPEKRDYGPGSMPMTEAGIDPGFFRDLFVALGEDLGRGAWSLRLYHKPFLRWIWLGAILMGVGGTLAAFDKRYRKLAQRDAVNLQAQTA